MNSCAWIAGLCPDELLCPFFLFGYITIKMIDDKRTCRQGLKDEMREILSGLSQSTIMNVLDFCVSQLGVCIEFEGKYVAFMPHK
jgi:hypothetical protein